MIRTYKASDAAAIRESFARAVAEIGARFYSPEQTAAWLANVPSAERLDEIAKDGRVRFVAVNECDVAKAFVDLEPDGHVDYLYCSPDIAGRGIGAALLVEAERRARENGTRRLFAEASEAALDLFRKKGFAVVERRDFAVRGVPIHNYAVEKDLSA